MKALILLTIVAIVNAVELKFYDTAECSGEPTGSAVYQTDVCECTKDTVKADGSCDTKKGVYQKMSCKPKEGGEGVVAEALSYASSDCSDKKPSKVTLTADTCLKLDTNADVYLYIDCSFGSITTPTITMLLVLSTALSLL